VHLQQDVTRLERHTGATQVEQRTMVFHEYGGKVSPARRICDRPVVRRREQVRAVERLLARTSRIERFIVDSRPVVPTPTRPYVAAAPVMTIPVVRRVTRVLHRKSTAPNDPQPEVRKETRRVESSRAAAPSSPADIERICDQVMRTIDRRLTADRERRGRI
jgi:hypothetical protein